VLNNAKINEEIALDFSPFVLLQDMAVMGD
jgi:hypothetical protein